MAHGYDPISEKTIKIALKRVDALVAMHDNLSQAVLLPYLAGIIDGEGTIRINRQRVKKHWNYSYHLQMSCGMVCKEIIELLQKIFGGGIHEERIVGYRPIWRWSLTGRLQTYAILKLIRTYLIAKKEHADLAIEFCDGWKNPKRNHFMWIIDPKQLSWREDMYWKMRELNATGKQAQRLNELASERMKQ